MQAFLYSFHVASMSPRFFNQGSFAGINKRKPPGYP
jgi:hypothetical protein